MKIRSFAIALVAAVLSALPAAAGTYKVRSLSLGVEYLMQAQMFEGDVDMARQIADAWGMIKSQYKNGIGAQCSDKDRIAIYGVLGLTQDEIAKFQ